jgi:hypothetical protein
MKWLPDSWWQESKMNTFQNGYPANASVFATILAVVAIALLFVSLSLSNCKCAIAVNDTASIVQIAHHTAPLSDTVVDRSAGVESSTDSGEPMAEDCLSIKQLMRYTMTQGLCQKVIKKLATPEEQARLVTLLEQLALLEPPLGSITDWRQRTTAFLTAAREVASGELSHGELALAANCTNCHKDHRPKL